jgi:hypothetical protein
MNHWYDYLIAFGMGLLGCVIFGAILDYFFPLILTFTTLRGCS